MRGKDHLYYLIHSLSKSEKRYFTLDAQKSGRKDSRYLELFRFINQQTAYDEKALKQKFGKKLADDKARLYEALLSSLRDYQSSKSFKTRVRELLTDAKILFERKLYPQCENRLSEAKALALELEDHLAILEINLIQRQLIKEYQNKNYKEEVEALIQEKDYHLGIIQQELWLQDTYDRLSVDFLRFQNKLNASEINALVANYSEVITFDIKDRSFLSLWRWYKIRSLYHLLKGDAKEAFKAVEQTAKLWEHYPKIQNDNYFLYISDVINLLAATSKDSEQFHKLPVLIANLKKDSPPSIQAQQILFE
ncbi:MAG: hypothetical protein D6772_02375, partial [Bacteroidetes bacterium]